jgi:hypothetical protein
VFGNREIVELVPVLARSCACGTQLARVSSNKVDGEMAMRPNCTHDRGKRTYDDPREIVESDSLSYQQKLAALENWRLDLLELQQATDENMPSAANNGGEPGEKLRQVNNALVDLRRLHTQTQ